MSKERNEAQQMDFQFIEAVAKLDTNKKNPALYLRRSFFVTKSVKSATLYITALGVYIGYLNGDRLGNGELCPGYTDYKHRVAYQTHDLSDRITLGENVIAAVVGDGWYCGCLGIGSVRNEYGDKIKLACRLLLEYSDGTQETIESDKDWRSSLSGPLRENDLKTIERYDARLEMPGWSSPGFDDSAWDGVALTNYVGKIVQQQGEDILPHERFAAKILKTPKGETVLDFGQNMAGRVSFTVSGSAGHTLSLTMGEVLDEDGNFTQKNLYAKGAGFISGKLGQRLEYILKDGKQTYTPHFLISGFRYVLLENWPEKVKKENFSASALYADLAFSGNFECSNRLINKLVENVRWSMKSNFVYTPTDCPTRERSGWTADISVFSESACYLADPERFLQNWLTDYMLEQSADGNLPYVVPEGGKAGRARGCMGWSDGIANLAMTLYHFYGDTAILEEVYDSVRGFVDFCRDRAKKKNPLLFFKAGAHRQYIIETGFHYGEWLEPGTAMYKDFIKALFVPDTEVTTAWFYHTTCLLVKMANILRKPDDAAFYTKLADSIRDAYRKEFLKNGKVRSKRQCRYLRPAMMDLATDTEKQSIMSELNRMCIENGYRIGTGFLTTWRVLDMLTQYGYMDTAYRMLENTTQPGWLYSVTKGATTVWENWYGLDDAGVPTDSHNHYAPGSVVAWLFSTCGGIRAEKPGFAEIRIQPIPGGSLTWANASYASCKGEIISSWRLEDGYFKLDVSLPDVSAIIAMPDGSEYRVQGGAHNFVCPWSY